MLYARSRASGSLRPSHARCDDQGCMVDVDPNATAFLCVGAMCMGCSCAAYFCKESVVYWVNEWFPGASLQHVRERHPPPRIGPGLPVLSGHIGHFWVFGDLTADANRASKGFATACARRDVGIHAEHSASLVSPPRALSSTGPVLP